MVKYTAVDVGFDFDCSQSDIDGISWTSEHLSLKFLVPGNKSLRFEVFFKGQTIIRVLDEVFLSSEQDLGDTEGIISENLFYKIDGSKFLEFVSEVFIIMNGPVEHYRLVTGGGCVDVASGTMPTCGFVEI